MRARESQENAMIRDDGDTSAGPAEALAYQARILGGVSRTFALTIPSLPDGLRIPVTNAYLLCRIADTLEDDPALSAERKRAAGRRFVEVLRGRADAHAFASETVPLLAADTPDDERDLLIHSPAVVEVTRALSPERRRALVRCVEVMSDGMHRFQQSAGLQGLASQARLDEYCYFVAGVVGEMLTELFCSHSRSIAQRRDRLMELAPSFGQGLQMTNILKDMWEDRRRGICWLPRTAFGASDGVDDLLGGVDRAALERGVAHLTVVAHGHLRNALAYTLLIPRRHRGVRRFCLWALGMAVPTLANIHARPGFRAGADVKISRPQVRAIVRRYGGCATSNSMLRLLFRRASRSLPESDPAVAAGLDRISREAAARCDTGQTPGEHARGTLGVN
jgi:farnesyl-diphosphate farnesyltransferase